MFKRLVANLLLSKHIAAKKSRLEEVAAVLGRIGGALGVGKAARFEVHSPAEKVHGHGLRLADQVRAPYRQFARPFVQTLTTS